MLPVFSVSEFIAQINQLILGQFVVQGEVATFHVSQGKWAFFDLKDANSSVTCFSPLFRLTTAIEPGMMAQVSGRPQIYGRSGRFSLIADSVLPIGLGAIHRSFILLKEKLATEGLFDEARKRPLPGLPMRVGVIASRDSAAWGDFQRILSERWRGVVLELRHVTVQGDEATADIVRALMDFNAAPIPCQVVVMIRGGGSFEDLMTFNSEPVVRAIVASRIPIVSGIGHERDVTLADLAADFRAATPSHAATILFPDRKDFIYGLNAALAACHRRLDARLESDRHVLIGATEQLSGAAKRSLQGVYNIVSIFNSFATRLKERLSQQQEAIAASFRTLQSLNPRRVLRRGYSLIRHKNGRLVRSFDQVDAGDIIMIKLGRGGLTATVTERYKK